MATAQSLHSFGSRRQESADALPRRILSEPFNDAYRLQYADWLEKSGDTEWAAMIRRDCTPRIHWTCNCKGGEHEPACESVPFYPHSSNDEDEEARLRVIVARSKCTLPPLSRLGCYRGFLAYIRCTCDFFLAHAGEIFSEHPIIGVTLTGKYPVQKGCRWGFTCLPPGTLPDDPISEAHFVLPQPIWDYYADITKWRHEDGWGGLREEFIPVDALCHACVTFGRTQAGLPYLLRDYRTRWPSPNFM
jgi:uncharacterized protein (TIGR02996 family)